MQAVHNKITLRIVYLALSINIFPLRIEFKYSDTYVSATGFIEILLIRLIEPISIHHAITDVIINIIPLPFTILAISLYKNCNLLINSIPHNLRFELRLFNKNFFQKALCSGNIK